MKSWILWILVILSALATPAVAQQTNPLICTSSPNGTNVSVFNRLRALVQIEQKQTPAKEKRFGWWAYCHDQLMKLGLVKELTDKAGWNCCGGAESGECRVTVVSVQARTTEIDGVLCSIPKNVPIHIIPRLRDVAGCSDAAVAMVCASQAKPPGSTCGSIHCVAVEGGIWN